MQGKCVEIAGENEVDGALDSLAQVFEDWISSNLHIQHCQKRSISRFPFLLLPLYLPAPDQQNLPRLSPARFALARASVCCSDKSVAACRLLALASCTGQ
jgi:hypothetical protein